jgi:hypothetical protein
LGLSQLYLMVRWSTISTLGGWSSTRSFNCSQALTPAGRVALETTGRPRTGERASLAHDAERAKSERSWRYYQIDASHSPHVTPPEMLAALLQAIVSERAK